jgi:hypothetical protein
VQETIERSRALRVRAPIASAMAASLAGLFVGLAVAEAAPGFESSGFWLPATIGIAIGILAAVGALRPIAAELLAISTASIARFIIAGAILALSAGVIGLLACFAIGIPLSLATVIMGLGASIVGGAVSNAGTLLTYGMAAR